MLLVRYAPTGDSSDSRVGVLDGEVIRPVTAPSGLAGLLAQGREELRRHLDEAADVHDAVPVGDVTLLPPIDGRTEVWCAGVTYKRSMSARMEESSEASVYDKVYAADRPELFMKSPAWRVVTDGEPVGIREDSGHDVPEAELAVVADATGEIVGYTVCNDMSSRSLEGANPLYLPQAKIYAGGCALASGIRPAWEIEDVTSLGISCRITRDGREVFADTTNTDQLARSLPELVSYLFRGNDFPDGAILATGTGIVPELDFALQADDVIDIAIDEVGTLSNPVAVGKEPFLALSTGARPGR